MLFDLIFLNLLSIKGMSIVFIYLHNIQELFCMHNVNFVLEQDNKGKEMYMYLNVTLSAIVFLFFL